MREAIRHGAVTAASALAAGSAAFAAHDAPEIAILAILSTALIMGMLAALSGMEKS